VLSRKSRRTLAGSKAAVRRGNAGKGAWAHLVRSSGSEFPPGRNKEKGEFFCSLGSAWSLDIRAGLVVTVVAVLRGGMVQCQSFLGKVEI
jgi:hypothetical protein